MRNIDAGGHDRRNSVIARSMARALYLVPAAALYVLFILWPLARLAVLSLDRWDGLTSPIFIGLSNYSAIFSDPGFSAELQHTLLWLVVTLIVPTVLGLLLALVLRPLPAGPRAALRALLILPLLLPTV
ncbi:MAG TPA: sugar ABC transporter permease, partial [Chloroflexota bacterium]|nr:sugar ABC transporter permease [Chloroflexota bacterium]